MPKFKTGDKVKLVRPGSSLVYKELWGTVFIVEGYHGVYHKGSRFNLLKLFGRCGGIYESRFELAEPLSLTNI